MKKIKYSLDLKKSLMSLVYFSCFVLTIFLKGFKVDMLLMVFQIKGKKR